MAVKKIHYLWRDPVDLRVSVDEQRDEYLNVAEVKNSFRISDSVTLPFDREQKTTEFRESVSKVFFVGIWNWFITMNSIALHVLFIILLT